MREKAKIVLLFCVAVFAYGIIVSLFTATVHINVDEELYVALAKSFHYNGKFQLGNELLNYNCVLYSMLISVAYFIYSPTTILFTMRMIGVIAMCSSVFPIYFFAKDILKNEKNALFLSVIIILMPYMFDSAYLMQEVLSYPLFMWTLYFLYHAYEKENGRNMIFLVIGAFFSVLCVFTKTYLFFIPVALNLCTVYYILKKHVVHEYIRKIAIYDGVYLSFFLLMYFMIFAVNGFEPGSNHYLSQFSRLFPINYNTLIFGVIGCIIYFAFFVINTGIIPIGEIFAHWKKEKQKSWIESFLLISVLFLIIEIVFMIVLTEEGTGTLPHKFLFRYFQIFVPPMLILFTKYFKESNLLASVKFLILAECSLFVALIYFIIMQGKTRQAIMDGHLFLLVENVSKYIAPYADVLAIILLMITLPLISWGVRRKKLNMQWIAKAGALSIVMFWMIQAVQLPYYTNMIADGRQIENDSIKIAEYLNDEKYDYVYYVYDGVEEENSYARNFYGYIKQPYQIITKKDAKNLGDNKEKIAFISMGNLLEDIPKLHTVNLNNEKLFLFTIE